MQRTELADRATRRPPHFTLLLIAFAGVSGCFPPPPNSEHRDSACGILYSCDDYRDRDQGRRGNDDTNTSSSSSDSGSSSSGTDTGTPGT